MCENKWYKGHSLLIFNDEYLFVFNIYYHYGDTHLSCIGNDNFGVLTQNVFDVLFVTKTYRSFLGFFFCFWFFFRMRHIFFYFPCMLRDWLGHDVK